MRSRHLYPVGPGGGDYEIPEFYETARHANGRGWDRKVEMVGDVAKKTNRETNTVWIYPPRAERRNAGVGDPERVTDL